MSGARQNGGFFRSVWARRQRRTLNETRAGQQSPGRCKHRQTMRETASNRPPLFFVYLFMPIKIALSRPCARPKGRSGREAPGKPRLPHPARAGPASYLRNHPSVLESGEPASPGAREGPLTASSRQESACLSPASRAGGPGLLPPKSPQASLNPVNRHPLERAKAPYGIISTGVGVPFSGIPRGRAPYCLRSAARPG